MTEHDHDLTASTSSSANPIGRRDITGSLHQWLLSSQSFADQKLESNRRVHRISQERTNMKITFLKVKLFSYLCCIVVLACTALGQSPTPSPDSAASAITPAPGVPAIPAATSSVAPVASATVAPTAAPSASPDTEEDFDKAIEKKIRKHFSIDLDGGHSGGHSGDDVPWIAIP